MSWISDERNENVSTIMRSLSRVRGVSKMSEVGGGGGMEMCVRE
jgi:hypothetical protein